MAQYQIGNQVYEVPDNLPPQQLQQILEQLAGGQAPQGPRDGAFAFGVDQAQRMAGKGIEAFGELVGSEGIRDLGTGIVEQQQQDIAAGGYQPQYGGSLTSYIGTENFFPALGEKVLENLATGGTAIVGTGAAALATLMGAPIIGLGLGATTLGGSVLLETGASAEEQEERTGDYDPATAATVGVVAGILDKVGAGKVIPKDKLARMTVGQVAEELARKGKTKAARDFVAQVFRSARGEALTELGQEGLQVAGAMTQGAEYNAQELVERGGDALMLGGTMGGGARAAIDTTSAIGTRVFGNQATDSEAATDLANRLQAIVEANNLNMSDVDKMSTKGAREAVDKAHIQIAEDMKRLVVDLRDRLKITDIDPITTVVDKVFAEAGRREARNKTKSVVGRQEFEATERLVGDTLEGQELLRLYRQSNELTELHNSGYVGGISRFTDQLSPFASNVGYTARSAAELPTRLLATGAGFTLNPAVPAAQGAAVLAGRGIDAITGRRSRVGRFIRQNQGEGGVQVDQDAPSLRQQRIDEDNERKAQLAAQKAAEAQQEADNKAMHKAIYDANGRFFEQSPQQLMLDGLGLSPQRAVQLLKDIAKNDPTFARTAQKAAKAFREGGRIPSMRYIGPKMKAELDREQPRVARDRPVIAQRLDEGIQRSAAIQQGINDNRDFNDQLRDALNNDKNIDNQSKAVANAALDNLRRDLGRTPVSMAEQIERDAQEKATDPNVIRNYVTPYVDRVRKQQGADDVVADLPPVEGFVDLRLPEEEAPKRKHRDIGELLMAEQAQRYGRDLDPYNDGGDFETVADVMTGEARMQMEKMPEAADWYDQDVKQALATTAEIIPEINQSEDNRQLYLLMAAITSVGHKPRINWRYAGSLAIHYFRTGEIGEQGSVYSEKRGISEKRTVNPATGNLFGLKAGSIEPGINILNHMVKKLGVAGTLDFVNSDKTKKEIDALRKEAGYGPQGKIKGGMNAVVPGIQLFGPKVGPFYLNLNGVHEVTVDLWASRTVRRHTGGLLDPIYDPNNKKSAADTGLVDAPTELERPTMKNLFARVGENLGVTPQAAQAILWAYEQELYNDLGARLEYEKFSEGAELFAERDAVAYEERYPRSATRQNRSRAGDRSPPPVQASQGDLFDDGEGQAGTDTRRDNIPGVVGSNPATAEDTRDAQPAASAMFEVGKPGSPYENGIKDIATAQRLAKALDAALHIASSKSGLGKIFGRPGAMGRKGRFNKGGAQQWPDPSVKFRDPLSGEQVRSVIGLLGEYNNPRDPRETVTPQEVVWVALHEIGHVIEGSFMPGKTTTQKLGGYRRLSDGKRSTRGNLYSNTFREALANVMDAAAGVRGKAYTKEEAEAILNEIVNLQRYGSADIPNPNTGEIMQEPVRGTYPVYNQAIREAEQQGRSNRVLQLEMSLFKREDDYFQTPAELGADLIGYYLLDPRMAKTLMPKATKVVRDLLNGGDVVTFYSMPLAGLVAVILANMMNSDREEEEQRTAGALSMGQGALSA